MQRALSMHPVDGGERDNQPSSGGICLQANVSRNLSSRSTACVTPLMCTSVQTILVTPRLATWRPHCVHCVHYFHSHRSQCHGQACQVEGCRGLQVQSTERSPAVGNSYPPLPILDLGSRILGVLSIFASRRLFFPLGWGISAALVSPGSPCHPLGLL